MIDEGVLFNSFRMVVDGIAKNKMCDGFFNGFDTTHPVFITYLLTVVPNEKPFMYVDDWMILKSINNERESRILRGFLLDTRGRVRLL